MSLLQNLSKTKLVCSFIPNGETEKCLLSRRLKVNILPFVHGNNMMPFHKSNNIVKVVVIGTSVVPSWDLDHRVLIC